MHFYAKDENGNVQPKHFVENVSKGGTRPSRTSEARKAKANGETWYASVTSVLGILDKPALVNWKVDKHLDEAYRLAKNGQEKLLDDWKRQVKAQTQEALDAAPKAGTDIHKVLEDNLEASDISHLPEVEQLIIENVRKALVENCCGYEGFDAEKYFIDEEHGFAGCADLSDKYWIIDYKSKQEASKFKAGKMAYPEHYRQLAAYSKAINPQNAFGMTAKCANIFICLETGEVDFHEHSEEDLEKGWLDFKDCLSIYKRNTYNEKEL